MEAEGHSGVVDSGLEDNKVVIPIAPMVPNIVVGEQKQGVKRTRRDRGSTAKERISKMPPCAAGKRSSIYRGVTRHRWTGRYEAHLWDKSTWNQSQNKKGKQVYLGAYDEEEAAARAYDLAALRYWGPGTLINFPLSDYARDVEEMQNVTREEYLALLRRKSSGFSRGVSKYRGVARHHHNGRWEARIGRVFGNKYLYLGTYSTQEEAAAAYDMAAIEYRGLNAITNFDLSRYIRWLRPGQSNVAFPENDSNVSAGAAGRDDSQITDDANGGQVEHQELPVFPSGSSGPFYKGLGSQSNQERSSESPTALGLLLQSPVFRQMLGRASAAPPTENDFNLTRPSEDFNVTDLQHPKEQPHHSHQEHLENSNTLYPVWGKQVGHHQPSSLSSLVEQEGTLYEEHEHSSQLYHQPWTANLDPNYHSVGGPHCTELEDQKQQQAQRYQDLCRQQHQEQLAAAYGGHGSYSASHGLSASALYDDQESACTSVEDGSWTFPNVLSLSNPIISTC